MKKKKRVNERKWTYADIKVAFPMLMSREEMSLYKLVMERLLAQKQRKPGRKTK